MKSYYNFDLKCDALLLVDVFEKFRNSNLKINWVMSESLFLYLSLNWDTMLSMTKVELELILDSDMYLFFAKGMKSGVSYFSNRYSKANNKYLKSCDPRQESKHIIYLDANDSFGYVMYKFLPTSRFKWIDSKNFDSNKYRRNSWVVVF